MAKLTLQDFDVPIVFAVALIFTVVGGVGLLSGLFSWLGWTGPLGLLKGGVA